MEKVLNMIIIFIFNFNKGKLLVLLTYEKLNYEFFYLKICQFLLIKVTYFKSNISTSVTY